MHFSKLSSDMKIIRQFRRIIFFYALLISNQVLNAQTYYFDSYGVAEGLAQSTVYDIVQDHNDYLWLGTRAGVSRFNGKEFNNYTIETGLAENGVRTILIDNRRNIWFGHSGGGVSIYDGQKFSVFSKTNGFLTSDVTSIIQDKNGFIWITSELSGVIKITETGATLDESKYEHYIGNKISDRVFNSLVTNDGTVYFVTDAFIKYYQSGTNSFGNLALKGMPSFFQITSMFQDSKENLWFGTYHGGLYKFQADADSFRIYDIRDGLSSNWISSITEDHSGNIWVGTWGGGVTLIQDDSLRAFNLDNGLQDIKIRKIIEDAEGNMLIGTNEHGLSIFKGEQFVSYFEKDGLLSSQVWSVIQDKTGIFWFGTINGISIFDESMPPKKQFTDFFKLKGNRVSIIREDSKGRIWIAVESEGIFTYNNNTGSYTYEPKLNSYLKELVVPDLATDNSGLVWAGTLDGLVSYDYDTREVNYYTQTSGLAGNEITSLYSDPKNRLWIGARGSGLTVLQDTGFHILKLDQDFTPTCMLLDQNGMLWIGTEAQGVMVIDPEKKIILENYLESDGLLANLINLLNIDDKNNIYIGTNKGLNIYNSLEKKLYAYTKKNGFVGIETKHNSTFRDKNGKLWFGTVSGVTRLDPDIIRKTSNEPLTHIIRLRINLTDHPLTEGLKLSHDKNDVIFDYISICLTNPEAVKYKIMLEGAESDWRQTTQTTAYYPSLAPKKYVFKVIAQNNDGNWNKEPISYAFQIKPPFYKTWWFILACILLGASAIIAYIKIREQNLIKEKRILEEKVIERTALVVAQKEELAQKNKDITDSIRYAKRIQIAILPPEIPFKDTFILFKPKDIVSGDFYWLDTIGDLEFLAAVDCTGHGVPGAFMSLIAYTSISKIVREMNIFKPYKILDQLNTEITRSLQQRDEAGGAIQDGMDMALICFNTNTRLLEFAGAFNPLWLVRNNEIQEIKADRYSIGRSTTDTEKTFTNHEIQIQQGDFVYFFSDGYADQFGGESGKKFMAKPLKNLIIFIQDQPPEKQKEILEDTIEAWRGDIEQVDDILIIGRKFS
jgi:ligand-binding sensor domain-containing protein